MVMLVDVGWLMLIDILLIIGGDFSAAWVMFFDIQL